MSTTNSPPDVSPPDNEGPESPEDPEIISGEKTGEYEKAPDGGARAWSVAAGAACISFCTLGFANSFGVFQEYYMTHQLQNRTSDDIAWIGSLSAFLQFGAGAIGGPLFDRYGAWVLRPAALLYIVGLMMISLCNEYWQFMLAQGVLVGAATGVLLFPAMAAVSQYFDSKRAAAIGIAVAGSSIGGVVLPIALSKMLNDSSLGFGWSVRVIGFLSIPLMAFSCLTVRPRLPSRQSNFFIVSAFKEPRFLLIVISMFFMTFGMFTPLFYIPSYAVTRGINPTLASYLLAVVNAASTFGRIGPGMLADKFGRLNIFMMGGLATGIIILCLHAAQTKAGLIVYSIVIGFFSGTIISGGSTALTLCLKDLRDAGTFIGMGMGMSSWAALIGPPVNGALIDRYGGFLQMSIFSGIMCLTGGFTALASKATTPEGLLGRV